MNSNIAFGNKSLPANLRGWDEKVVYNTFRPSHKLLSRPVCQSNIGA